MDRLAALLLLTLSAAAAHGQATGDGDLGFDPDRTMNLVSEWVRGYYNNQRQVDRDLEQGVPDDHQHRLMHQLFVPVEVPSLPGHVVFQQASTDGTTDPRWIVRHGLLQFFVDEELGLVRQRELAFAEPEPFKNGFEKPELLNELSSEDLTFDAACDFHIDVDPDGRLVAGPIPGDGCRLQAPGTAQEMIADDRIEITPDQYAFLGRYVDVDGNVMWGTHSDELNRLDRIQNVPEYLASQQSNVLIFGATGGTGLELAKLLVGRGDSVTAFVRPTSNKTELEALGVDFVVGDALNTDDVVSAFQGKPYRTVISTLGCRSCDPRPDFLGNKNVIDAAKTNNVGHFLLVTSIGAGDSADAPPWPARWFLKDIVVLKTQAEDYLRDSGLPYTILRPGALKDGAASNRGTLSEDRDAMGVITRADLAALVVQCMDDPGTVGKTFATIDPELRWPWDMF